MSPPRTILAALSVAVRCTLLLFALGSMSASTASAGIILAWNFDGNAGDAASVAATTNLLGGTAEIIRGPGIVAQIPATGHTGLFNSSGWTNGGTLANAAANGDYLQFSFVVPTNMLLSLDTLDANFRRYLQAPQQFQWQYGIGGTFTNIGSFIPYTSSSSLGINQPDVALDGISALQNISGGTEVTFRMLAGGATVDYTEFGFGRNAGNDLVLSGTLSAVPEPGSLALCGSAASAALLRAWRRRRRTHAVESISSEMPA